MGVGGSPPSANASGLPPCASVAVRWLLGSTNLSPFRPQTPAYQAPHSRRPRCVAQVSARALCASGPSPRPSCGAQGQQYMCASASRRSLVVARHAVIWGICSVSLQNSSGRRIGLLPVPFVALRRAPGCTVPSGGPARLACRRGLVVARRAFATPCQCSASPVQVGGVPGIGAVSGRLASGVVDCI